MSKMVRKIWKKKFADDYREMDRWAAGPYEVTLTGPSLKRQRTIVVLHTERDELEEIVDKYCKSKGLSTKVHARESLISPCLTFPEVVGGDNKLVINENSELKTPLWEVKRVHEDTRDGSMDRYHTYAYVISKYGADVEFVGGGGAFVKRVTGVKKVRLPVIVTSRAARNMRAMIGNTSERWYSDF